MKVLMRSACFAAVLAAVGAWTVRCVPGEPVPNIILVVIDTLRWDALGHNGNPHLPTPRIDDIASENIVFNQAISTSGWTLPAVASVLTGTWPLIHGGIGKQTTLSAIRDEVPTAAEMLQANGFNTIAFTNAAFLSPQLGIDRGFDIFDHRNAYTLDIRRADETVGAALEQLRRHRDEPNFMLIHLYDPHLDYDPPPGYISRFTGGRTEPPPPVKGAICRRMAEEAGGKPPEAVIDYIKGIYLGEVAFVDAQIGRLVDSLEEMGLYDRTTLIITSDHGEEFWEHGGFEHGHTLYDELVHVPLVLKLPGNSQPAEKSIDAQVRILDIMPTVFDIVGIEQPESFAGISLLPMIRGEERDDRIAYSESTLYGKDRIAWRKARYKYLYDFDPDVERKAELYDWVNDPEEQNNLIDSHPEIAQRLENELKAFARELTGRANRMSTLQPVSLAPEQLDSLKSLGYVK
jgi:arylsulfatase A-like enzyme